MQVAHAALGTLGSLYPLCVRTLATPPLVPPQPSLVEKRLLKQSSLKGAAHLRRGADPLRRRQGCPLGPEAFPPLLDLKAADARSLVIQLMLPATAS